MKVRSVALLIVALTLAACASLPLKNRISAGHQTVREALVILDDAERQICFLPPTLGDTLAPLPVNHCTNPLALTVGLTDAKHQAFSRALAAAYAADAKVSRAIIAWHAGDPVPADLTTLLADATTALAAATDLGVNAGLITQATTFLQRVLELAALFGQ